jgi:ABC-type multidrug transport system ATPase subunit
MLSLVLSLHEEDQMGLVVITHRLEDILDADRVLALAEGAVALEGTVGDVLARISSRPELRVALPLALAVGELVRSEPIRALLTAQVQRAPVAGASREP